MTHPTTSFTYLRVVPAHLCTLTLSQFKCVLYSLTGQTLPHHHTLAGMTPDQQLAPLPPHSELRAGSAGTDLGLPPYVCTYVH